jgi:hypothetical protein
MLPKAKTIDYRWECAYGVRRTGLTITAVP